MARLRVEGWGGREMYFLKERRNNNTSAPSFATSFHLSRTSVLVICPAAIRRRWDANVRTIERVGKRRTSNGKASPN